MSHCCWRCASRWVRDNVEVPRWIRHPSGQRAFAFLLLLLFGVRFGPLPFSVLRLLFAASRVGFGWRPFVVLVLFRRWSLWFFGFSALAFEKHCRTLAVQRKDVIHEWFSGIQKNLVRN